MKAAILYICTGRYAIFWKQFYETYDKNFLPNTSKTYFVYTDHKNLPYSNRENVCVIPQKDLGWPNNTLQRFSLFIKEENRWQDYDYTFFINANFLCPGIITEEEFLPKQDTIKLIMAEHAGHHGWEPSRLPYERNPKSLAYVEAGEGSFYVMGGMNGGKTKPYMEMIHHLKENVDIDAGNGIVARCHDESHLNHFIIGRDDVLILPPSYGYPEGWNLPYKAKMFIRDKSKYFDVEALKAGGLWGRIKLYAGRIKSKIAIRIRIRKLINWFRKGA